MSTQRLPAGIYGILDPERTDDPVKTAQSWTRAGITAIQLRWKTATARKYLELAETLRDLCRREKILFVVNDRVDVARCLVTACHIGPEDLPLPEARSILGPKAIIGTSTNSFKEARWMAQRGADYIGFGPLFPTSSKDQLRPYRTLAELQRVANSVEIPVVGIGGITAQTAGSVIAHGARAAAVIGALHGKEPGKLALRLVEAARHSQ